MGIQVLAFSVSYWFFSVNRAILLWFPLWMMIGALGELAARARPAGSLHRIASSGWLSSRRAVLMLAWSWLYFTGNWAS